MKHSDRMLLHTIDAATDGAHAPGRTARAFTWAWLIASTHAIAFAVGFLMGRT